MLVLSRRPNEKILFPDIQAFVQVISVRGNQVRLGVVAPREITVLREELAPADQPPPSNGELAGLGGLLERRLQALGEVLALLRKDALAGSTQDAETTLSLVGTEMTYLRRRLQREGKPDAAPAPGKALLVEDNANERELLALLLRRSGLQVDTAADGSEALDYLHRRGRPDVVLLDMGLPRLDGASTVREIRRDPAWAGLKVFAVSGRAREEVGLDEGPSGVDRWFQKPVDPDALLQELGRA